MIGAFRPRRSAASRRMRSRAAKIATASIRAAISGGVQLWLLEAKQIYSLADCSPPRAARSRCYEESNCGSDDSASATLTIGCCNRVVGHEYPQRNGALVGEVSCG